jgi:hypothetical protein
MAQLQTERARREESYRKTGEKEYRVLHGDSDRAQRKRDFFLAQEERQWQDYVKTLRPRLQRDLARLRELE